MNEREKLRLGVFLVSVLLFSAGCGGGDDREARYRDAMASFSKKITPEVRAWAAGVSGVYGGHIRESDGLLDENAAKESVGEQSRALGRSICQQLEAQEKILLGEGQNSHNNDTQSGVSNLIWKSFAEAALRNPKLMFALGLTTWEQWPSFLMKDPGSGRAEGVATDLDTLRSRVKPEFLDPAGRLLIPSEGMPGYTDFEQWFFFEARSDTFTQAMSVAGYKATNSVHACIYDVPEN